MGLLYDKVKAKATQGSIATAPKPSIHATGSLYERIRANVEAKVGTTPTKPKLAFPAPYKSEAAYLDTIKASPIDRSKLPKPSLRESLTMPALQALGFVGEQLDLVSGFITKSPERQANILAGKERLKSLTDENIEGFKELGLKKSAVPFGIALSIIGDPLNFVGGGSKNIAKLVAKSDDANFIFKTLRPVVSTKIDDPTLLKMANDLVPIKDAAQVEKIFSKGNLYERVRQTAEARGIAKQADTSGGVGGDYNFKDAFGGKLYATIENGKASIYSANAREAGHGLYENAIKDLSDKGVTKIEVTLQSVDSQQALNRLVEKGVLKNPRGGDPRVKGGGASTIFDINYTSKSSPSIPKELEGLAAEARKYKSAEEFVKYAEKPSYSLTEKPSLAPFVEEAKKAETFARFARGTFEVPIESLSPGAGRLSIRPGQSRTPFEPLFVSPPRQGLDKFVVDDGNHRLFAAIDKGDKTIKVKFSKSSFDDKGYWGQLRDFFLEARGQKPTSSQLTDFYNKVGGAATKQVPIPEGLPAISKATSGTISETSSIKAQSSRTPQAQPKKAEIPFRPESKAKVNQAIPESQTTSSSETVAQRASVVNEGEKVKNVSESTYAENRALSSQNTGKIQRIREGLSAALGSLGEGADKILGTISTRLKNIDPSLKKAIRDFEFKLANNTQKDRRAVEPFLKSIRSKSISPEDYADLDLALKNGHLEKIEQLISKYGLEKEYAAVRETLDDIYKRAQDVGYDIGYEKNYFPRMVEDKAGMLEYFGKGDDWSLIDDAIRAKETDIGRYLTVDEKANLINNALRGFTGKIILARPGATKGRRIDLVDGELNQFYRDSVDSLLRYIDSLNDAIEARRFFGKGGQITDEFSNLEDSIGWYVLNLMAEGKVKPSQERELRDILRARFSQVGTNGVVRVYKNLSYIDTMGSFTSAVTQIGDLAFAIYKAGPVEAAKALGKAIVGRSEITRSDIGIEKIAQEFQDSARSALAVSKVFKLVGIEKIDSLGKETVINSVISKYRKLAQEPTLDFLNRIEAIFAPEDVPKVLEDLKTGKVTENVKLIAFNELLDVQPVALSEMPEQYLKGGNGRIFYMLKTYTIKLFDVYRNEVFQQIRTNPVQGIKNLLYLTGSLVAMNATADEIKDLLLDRETSLKDRTVDNILKLAGFSKFTIYKARQEGVGSAVAKTILPPFKFIDSLYKDILQAEEVSELETIQSIPIGGKLYYWWFGKGATKTEEKRSVSTGGSKTLKTPPGLPPLPSPRKLLPAPPGLPALP